MRAAYDELRTRGGLLDLSSRVKLRLTGADRVRYLNGQVTSNVLKLAAGCTQPACVTTAKGRLCAEVMITAGADALLVDADPALRETLPARLERYIIADDVELADVSDNIRLLHLLPPADVPIAQFLTPEFTALGAAISRRLGRDGLDFFLAADGWESVRDSLAKGRAVIDDALAETLRIEAGVPRWGHELDEDTLPPEAGLDRTHIDYHKGCYIGQEVISRLKSVGHVNRTLMGFVSEDGTPLAVGAQIFAPGDDARAVGTLTSTATSFALEKQIALGYLKRGSPTRDLIARPADSTGAETRVTARELPFAP